MSFEAIYLMYRQHMIFLGSCTDEFQQTTLLISINLPPCLPRLPPAWQLGTPICQNRWEADQYVLYQNQFPPPLPIEILSTTYRGRLIWYWYVIRWVCTGTFVGFVMAILKCESGCFERFLVPSGVAEAKHTFWAWNTWFLQKDKLTGRKAQQWRGEEVMQAERKKWGFKREGRDRAGDRWMDGWMEVKEGERASVKNASLSSKASLGPLQRVCSHVCTPVSFCPVGINTLQSHCVLRWTPPWRPVPSKHTSPSFSFSFTVLLTSLSPSL